MPVPYSNSVNEIKALFLDYFGSLCNFASRYVANNEACKEVVHNAFKSIWLNRRNTSISTVSKSHLFNAVHHQCMTYLRNEEIVSLEDSKFNEEPEFEYADKMRTSELESELKLAISELPAEQKYYFEQVRFKKKNYNDIADELNVSIKVVENGMRNAMKRLRLRLEKYLPFITALFMIF